MKKLLCLFLLLNVCSLFSRPVDLSAPTTELGTSTKDGFLSLHRELGEIDFGRELALPLRLFFQSAPQTCSACFGTSGWSIPVMDSKITFLDENRIEVYLPCGKTTYMIKNLGTGKFKSIDGDWDGVYDKAKEKLTITRDDGWEIDWVKGKIKRLKNDEGRELVWDYESGVPLLIKEGDRKVFELTRSQKRVEVIRVGAKEYRIKYDFSGRIEEVKWPSGRKELYQWSACPKGNPILKMVTKTGREESFSWDRKLGYILTDSVWSYRVEEMEPEKVKKEGEIALVRVNRENKFGQKESYFNDREKGEVTTVRADGVKILLTRFVTPGKIYHKTRKIEETENGVTTTVYQASYDEGGRRIREIDALGNETKFSYLLEGSGDLAKIKTQIKTDAIGGKWVTDFNADEFPISTSNPLSEKTLYEWDSKRHLLSVTNPLNVKVANFTYDDRGLMVELKDALQNKIDFSYDEEKKLVKVKDSAQQEWRLERNEEGEEIALVNPLNERIELERNHYGKVQEIKDALGNKTRYEYDSMSRLKGRKDANGNQTQWQWNDLDQVTQTVDANRQVVQIGYDLMNRQNKVVDPQKRVYQMAYQKDGERTELKFADGKSDKNRFDANGNRVQFTNRAGTVFKYKYDKLNRLVESRWPQGTCLKYAYDGAGRLIRAEKSGTVASVLLFTYDSAGRLISESQNGKSVGYSYDLNSRLIQLIYPSGRAVSYSYDSRGLATRIASTEGVFVYQRDPLGRVTSKTSPNQTVTSQSFDRGDRLTGMALKDKSGKVLWSNRYEFDKVGNRTSTEYADGKKDSYEYDSLYQITSVRYGAESKKNSEKEKKQEGTLDWDKLLQAEKACGSGDKTVGAYVYDSLGNRKYSFERGKSAAYANNDLNQYISSGKSFYQYSTRGDLLSEGAWNCSYDLVGNLIGASNGSTTVQFEFDAMNRRVSKTVNGKKEVYLYSGLDRIADEVDGALKAEYLFERGIDRPIQIQRGTETYFVQQDILGNVVTLTGVDAKVKETVAYEVFGLPTIKDEAGKQKGSSISPFLFTAREHDSEIGLYHYRARAYSPVLGRFLQMDPIDLAAGDLNLYRYCGNNSISWRDPSGLFLTLLIPIYEVLECITITTLIYIIIDFGVKHPISLPEVHNEKVDPKIPSLPDYQDDPSVPPADDWVWKGKGVPGSNEGSWVSPDGQTKVHPDRDHGPPIGPHNDVKTPNGDYRQFPGGSVVPK